MTKGTPAYSYLRLSAADGREEESHSIANQREFLRQWARRAGFALQREFVDDGHTGTDFDRPAFRALMEELRRGPVRCFVTVDLSRLGRNYLEVGRLQEEVFPALGIRYIAVNDDYDSARSACGGLDPAVFKNLLNDLYAKDASQKALRAKRTLQRQGKYLGGSPPYGYRLDEADRYRLLPDEATAPVVRRIYEDCLAGQSCTAIARALTGEGVPAPAARKGGQDLRGLEPLHRAADSHPAHLPGRSDPASAGDGELQGAQVSPGAAGGLDCGAKHPPAPGQPAGI